MYARLYQFTIDPARMDDAEKLADIASGILKKQKGFHSVSFFTDGKTGECGSFSLWETRADVDAFVAAEFPELKGPAIDLFKGPSKSAIFEVYDPK